MSEDLAVENEVLTNETQTEAPEVANDTDAEDVDQTEGDEGETAEGDEPEISVEEKLEKAESERQALEKKTLRQKKAYAAMQRKLEETTQQLQQFAQQQQQAAQKGEPNIDDFETHEEYVNAVADYRAEQKLLQKSQEQLAQQQKAEQARMMQERNKQYEAQKSKFVVDYPDYQRAEAEFMEYAKDAERSVDPYVQNAVIEQLYREDNVPAVINYFGENNGERIAELEQISQMSPIEAAIEIYKIQQKLKAVKPEKKKDDPLPKPPKSVKATGNAKNLHSGDVLKNLGLK